MIIINTQSFVDSPIDKPVEDAEAATAGSLPASLVVLLLLNPRLIQ